VPLTGRHSWMDSVYVMQFEGDRIVHMTKIWNAGLAMKDLGWAGRTWQGGFEMKKAPAADSVEGIRVGAVCEAGLRQPRSFG